MKKKKNKKVTFPLSLFPFFTAIIFILLVFIILSSCTSTTSSQTGNLSGTIQLEGETNHSNITVGIYELVTLDTTITRINAKYPHIGIKISQHTEFDHRFAEPIRETQTDANGNFKITDIPTGRYNFVVMKHGFGFRYIYNVQINEGSNSLSNFTLDSNGHTKNTADLTLFPETYIHEDITASTTFESYHHYIIQPEYGDYLEISSALTIEPGAVIRLAQGVGMTICEKLTAIGQEDNWIWFTSNDSILNSPPKSDIELYKSVELSGTSDKEVRFCKFDNAGTGLLSTVNGFSISNCIFRNSLCGFHTEGVDSTFCSNLLCEEITNEQMGGIYFEYHTNGIIEKNICLRCENGIKVKTHSNPEVKNNYIDDCNTGIHISYYSSSNVHNNEIYGCEIGVYALASSYPEIYRNGIQSNYGIVIYRNFAPNIIKVNYNNLNCNKYVIQLIRHGNSINSDMDAKNNYFYTTDETEIQELIFDKNDVEGPDQQYYGIVNYIPFLTQEYYNAGIKEGL